MSSARAWWSRRRAANAAGGDVPSAPSSRVEADPEEPRASRAGAESGRPTRLHSVGGVPATPSGSLPPTSSDLPPDPASLEQARLARAIHAELLVALDLRRADVDRLDDAELRSLVARLVDAILERLPLPPRIDRARLAAQVLDEAVGLGPLEALLADETVSEIMVNGPDDVFVERSGRLHRAPVAFSSEDALYGIVERIVTPLGRRVDEASPLVDARLADGSRVNVVIPPLAIGGPAITIRKFARRRLRIEDLVAQGALDDAIVEFLRVCVTNRRNVVVAGGTGSGKTTLLNVLSNLVPPGERIVTIEDAAELRLAHANLVTLESRPRNLEGQGEVTIRDLVRNALRMRPDRIVVGECRGGETLDMLQAMNTGHDGSLTTAHANSPRDLLSRLEVMALMAGGELPVAAVREQIAAALHVVVQQTRFPCGARRVTAVVEITGLEAGRIQLQEVFVWRRTGVDPAGRTLGHHTGCGYVPTFYDELRSAGVPLDYSAFEERRP